MIDIAYIRSFFPPAISGESRFDRYILKEYLQLLILNHISGRLRSSAEPTLGLSRELTGSLKIWILTARK